MVSKKATRVRVRYPAGECDDRDTLLGEPADDIYADKA
jgi:hypothetical protein